MNKSPAFQFYVNDWLSSTQISLMTPSEEGAYIRLLCYAWNDPDCSIPDNDEILAALSRLGEGWLKGGSRVVRKCFQPHPTIPGKLINLRLLKEKEKQSIWREKSSEGGKKSAKLRELKDKKGFKGGSRVVQPPYQPNGNSSSSSSFSSSSSSSSLKEKEPKEHIVDLHEEIIKDLNLVLGTNYRHTTKDIQKLLRARLDDKYTLADFKTVHRNMFQSWGKDPKMGEFLRPHTLYTEKFQSYLNKRPPTLSQQGIVSEKTEKNIEVVNRWLASEEAKDKEDGNAE